MPNRDRLILLASIHAYYIGLSANSTNATFDLITTSVIRSVHLGWSLISATIICLKPFVLTLGSGYLGATINHNLVPYTNSSERHCERSGGQGNGLSARRVPGREETYTMNVIRTARPQSTPDTGGHNPDIQGTDSHVQQSGASIGSVHRISNDGSQELIIRRTMEYRIDYVENVEYKPRRNEVAS